MDTNWKEDIIKNRLGGKRDWTDQERIELCQQLDKEIDQSFENNSGKRIEDGWTEENWKDVCISI